MTTTPPPRRALSHVALTVLALGLAGCGSTMERIADIGQYPSLSPINNPQKRAGYAPVSMPMPAPQDLDENPNSLWRTGAKQFFKDIRAKEVGDTLTVRLRLDDKGKMQNNTNRKRDDNQKLGVDAMFGYEGAIRKFLPNNANNLNLVAVGGKMNTDGDGDIKRAEQIELTFAAEVVQVLPNGFLVIQGHNEVRVNYELRELVFTGIVRPTDIEADNSIPNERVAEMRVAYGGRGTLSELQQPRWGTQLLDIVLPF